MFKKKCPSCAKKIEKKFNFCPYCGVSFKSRNEQESFGMLGRNDFRGKIQPNLGLPLGMNKIVNSLVKQLEKQMNDLGGDGAGGMPKGFKIRIAQGQPQMRQVVQGEPREVEDVPRVSEEENNRRSNLPREEVKSKVRRLADRIIYEMKTPGVKRKKDVVVTKLASGLEIKAYSKNKCYVKFIPLTVEVIEYYVEAEKVFVELKA